MLILIVSSMDLPKVPLLHKIGYTAFILTGIPLPVKGKSWALVWVKLAICHLCLWSKVLMSMVAPYYLLNDDLSSLENTDRKFD